MPFEVLAAAGTALAADASGPRRSAGEAALRALRSARAGTVRALLRVGAEEQVDACAAMALAAACSPRREALPTPGTHAV